MKTALRGDANTARGL